MAYLQNNEPEEGEEIYDKPHKLRGRAGMCMTLRRRNLSWNSIVINLEKHAVEAERRQTYSRQCNGKREGDPNDQIQG